MAQDFSKTVRIKADAKHVFEAICNVRGWWSEDIEGETDRVDAVFDYHYEDVHFCKIRVIEMDEYRKVMWQVLDNHFSFVQDQSEWLGTKVIFELRESDGETILDFMHRGLLPEHECYAICHDAWTNYISSSLVDLVEKHKGQPNPRGGRNSYQEEISRQLAGKDFECSINVNASAQRVYECVNDVTKWWTENLEGASHEVGDEFTVRFGTVHISTQRVTELIPNTLVVWKCIAGSINFVENSHEWTNTTLHFEIESTPNGAKLTFRHCGLKPKLQCYSGCSNAWTQYISGSLKKLIEEGIGEAEKKVE